MQRRCAFTLVELLVVVAIIVLLLAILLPSLGKAREIAKAVKCSSNLRQAALATIQYTHDYADYLPPGGIQTSNQWNALMLVQDYMFPESDAYVIGWGNNDWPGKSPIYCPSWEKDNQGASGRYTYAFVNHADGGFATYYNGGYLNGKGPINTRADFLALGGLRRHHAYASAGTGMFVDHTTWRCPQGFLRVYSTHSQRMRFPHPSRQAAVVYMDGHAQLQNEQWAHELQLDNALWRRFAANGLNF